MSALRRWIASALTLAALISFALAAPAEEPFADFRIDASAMDVPDRDISISLYQLDDNGAVHTSDVKSYSCKLNRVTKDAGFYIQPREDGVWVTVDYLTDLDGDGVYELPDDSTPAWDGLNGQGGLTQGEKILLAGGQTCILSAETLSDRFSSVVQSRAQALSVEEPKQSFPLCRVTLHCTNSADGQDHTQLYYLELYGKLLLPYDIAPDQWYYSAVEYGLARGWFTGMEDGRFGPDEHLNRAQLAQVLWTMGGCPEAEGSRFSDVDVDDWFYRAVSWCQQEGLISGYYDNTFSPGTPLTREQLASILHRYARYSGSSLRFDADLSQYDDQDRISSWAYDSMRWAVSSRLLTADGQSLRPTDTVTRAELAAALYVYETNLSVRSFW